MRKYLPYTTKKSIQSVFLVSLFIASILMVGVPHVSASVPKIELNPTEIVVSAPGQNFTVDVNVTDVAGLGAWEYKITYNTTLLDAVWEYKTTFAAADCEYFGPVDPISHEWTPTSGINDSIGGGLGQVWTGASVKSGREPTGNVSLMTIKFTATAMGTCTLHFAMTVLGDSLGDPIDHVAIDGSVTVVPEFPAALIMPLLAILTLIAVFFGKMFWSRKRKGCPHLQIE